MSSLNPLCCVCPEMLSFTAGMQLNQAMTLQQTAVPHCLLLGSASKLPIVPRLLWCVQVKAQMQDPAALKQSLSSVRLVMRVFYSMNSPGLTEVSSCACCAEQSDALLSLHQGSRAVNSDALAGSLASARHSRVPAQNSSNA